MKNITVVLSYQLTDEFIRQEAVRLGKCPDVKQRYEFLLESLSPETRQQLLAINNVYEAKVSLSTPYNRPLRLGYLVTDDNYRQAVSDYLNFMAEYRREQEERRAEEERRQAEIRADMEKRQAERAAAEKAKKTWVEEYGSERLKKAFSMGYECGKLYATERAALEFPGFVVDLEGRTDWGASVCPSLEALELEEEVRRYKFFDPDRMETFVCKLTRPPYPLDYGEDWEPKEAVVVRRFLGKYDLIREL